MLSRFFSTRRPHLLGGTVLIEALLSSQAPSHCAFPLPHPPRLPILPTTLVGGSLLQPSRAFSRKRNSGDGDERPRRFAQEPPDESADSLFGAEEGDLAGIGEDYGGPTPLGVGEWSAEGGEEKADIFEDIEQEIELRKHATSGSVDGGVGWETAEGFKPWGFEEEGEKVDIFGDVEEETAAELECSDSVDADNRRAEEKVMLEVEEKSLRVVLKGRDHAFGDLITASGITDEMLDSLILLRDVRGVEGLPSLRDIEDMYIERSDNTTRSNEEQKKQQEISEARVKNVDEKGRAYDTGRRKCSIARVFIQPGDGKFIINDKAFDVYFPCLDHRAELLSPFLVTDTVGRWDVNCTVKGGGLSGQVGAIRLGISRALQNFEPGFRQYLRPEGLLTRDARVVERKKPGKAKARKSFQWVKR